MSKTGFIAVFVGTMVFSAAALYGQDYPNRPVRIITSTFGSGSDFVARVLGQAMSPRLGQQVIVDNRVVIIGIETASKASADGYSLLLIGSAFWLTQFFQDNVSWDPMRDFVPISLTSTSPYLLAVHPSLPVKSVKELIALAKAKPGQLNYSSGGTGSSSHLMGALFSEMAGIDIVRISYKSGSQETSDLLAGQVQMTFNTPILVTPLAKSGKLRALAVTSLEPSAIAPGLPTMAASGVPGYSWLSINTLFAPSKTPPSIIARLNQEVVRALAQPDVKEKLFNAGLDAVGSTPQELTAMIKNEITKSGKLIKASGISAN